ncbi:hypothetical protein tloyanaT_05720 [Thalassotalea loyana]|uniref:diguanylate cyclase n=1 Tax=Thalassotalea loyana TaxID=280483 RepID=A0ABQ6HAJ0_9GAMM|nr:GGDEF domain-containing protein [Thalassotalea loyana]GLX84320.1 hypothetical protein tloyanaT_05720 [Thalassotalea loyana]
MKSIKLVFLVFLLVISFSGLSVTFQTVSETIDKTSLQRINPLLDSSVTFAIRDDVKSLFNNNDVVVPDDITINRLLLKQSSLNNGELYLVYMVQAVSLLEREDFNEAHDAFETAIEFEGSISESQRSLPLFNQLYLLQSKLYEHQENYKLAYDKRDVYFDRMIEHYKSLNKKRILSLKEKYQTEIKQNNNELLKNQNELKQLQLQKLVQKEQQQRHIIWVVSVVILIFIALIIRQFQIRKRLKTYSETDALTGIDNRKVLFDLGAEIVEQAKQDGAQVSVLLFDLDHFKKINDQYGHPVGDEVLIKVANLAKETVRSRDLLVRFGGEEFIAILPDASIEQAKAMAERLREKIAQCRFDKPLENIKITTSVGVATLAFDMSLDQLINNADVAMYQAKLSGRDTALIYHDEMEHKPANYRRNS